MKFFVCGNIYLLWEVGNKGMSSKAPYGETHPPLEFNLNLNQDL